MKEVRCLLVPKDRLNTLLVGHSERPATFFRLGANTKSADAVRYTTECIESYLKDVSVTHYALRADHDAFTVYCGADESSLNRLIQATGQPNDRGIGEALGYPDSAIDAYCRANNPRRANPDFFGELFKANNEGIKIPQWVGYISHLPSICDLVSGQICEESAKLGAHYREVASTIDPKNLGLYDQMAEQMVPARSFIDKQGCQQFLWN